ncbi:MAG: potassium/proton antiporter [Streptosporangiales bacterium]
MSESVLPITLLLATGVLVFAVFAVKVSGRLGLPSLLFFLGLGLVIEPLGISISDPALAQTLGLAGLVVILAEGGLTTSWQHVRGAMPAAILLATVGVAVSMVLIALAAHFLVDLPWKLSLLLGAIVSSTDAAAVFSVLRRLPLPPKLSGTLEAESGSNDPLAVLLVASLSTTGPMPNPLDLVGHVVLELVIGGAIGAAIGLLGAQLLRRLRLVASGLHSLTALGLAIGAYGVAHVAYGSGFLAVYITGIIIGNARLPHAAATRGFAEGFASLAQIGLFVMLGVTAFPERLPAAIIPALLVCIGIVFSRPIAVVVSTFWFRLPWREYAFLSWAGLRGAVPIVLATIPATVGLRGSNQLFDIVVVLVVVLTLLQGPTLPFVARWLRIVARAEPQELEVESAPLEDMSAEMLQLQIPRGSEMAGIELFELRLPAGASVTLVVRGGNGFVPAPTTLLRPDDQLLIVATSGVREATERRLRAVHRRGRLAGWLGESGAGDEPEAAPGPS